MADHTTRVLIIGAGPVGLFLGLALQRLGVPCVLLDRRTTRLDQSRAVGIHAPCLELFDELGLGTALLAEGRVIRKGIARTAKRVLGVMSFDAEASGHPHVLTLPQNRTEHLLEESARARAIPLYRGVTPESVREDEHGVTVLACDKADSAISLRSEYVVGCDGRDSWVRQQAGIAFGGGAYRDRYMMGDFPDHLEESDAALIYLSQAGLVEALPLPEGKRRWVVRLPDGLREMTTHAFCDEVRKRTGVSLSPDEPSYVSRFGIEHYRAERVVSGRLVLAGDAAHVMSPIGGQGMNVGWMDAWDLAHMLATGQDLLLYERVVRKRAVRAIRRAHFNTRMGRPIVLPALRHAIVRLMLNTPLRRRWMRRFTMRDLPRLSFPA